MSIRPIDAVRDPAVSSLFDWKGKLFAFIVLAIVLPTVIIFSCTLGTIHIPFLTCFQVLLSKLPVIDIEPGHISVFDMPLSPEYINKIIIDIRLPRILLAGLVGMGLSVSGATYQRLLHNPLADPYTLGVASGAGLGATAGFIIPCGVGLMHFGIVPVFAFIGGLGAVALVYMIARTTRALSMTALILAGVPVSHFLSAITWYLMISHVKDLHEVFFWLLGGLSSTTWTEVGVVFPCIIAGMAVIQLHARPLNVLQLDEEQAQQLGVNVNRVKVILIVTSTFITSASICFAGIIGFVGIIIPHAVRMIWGNDFRFVIPFCAMVGAIFLILADTFARTLFSSGEVPLGVVTALCGVPVFIVILRKRKAITL